jgi:hypothetical protein
MAGDLGVVSRQVHNSCSGLPMSGCFTLGLFQYHVIAQFGIAPTMGQHVLLCQQCPCLIDVHGLTEIPALSFGTAECTKLVDNLVVFNAFGSDWHIKAGAQPRDSADDSGTFCVIEHRGDKAAVDLDAVKRKRAKMRKRAVAGTEVVERNLDALILEAAND